MTSAVTVTARCSPGAREATVKTAGLGVVMGSVPLTEIPAPP